MKPRHVLLLLVSFWLALGQLAGALAQPADLPCESMSMSIPADDCCGEGKDAARCLSACAASTPATIASVAGVSPLAAPGAVVSRLVVRHADVSGPPDIAPPKSLVS